MMQIPPAAEIEVQYVVSQPALPEAAQLRDWAVAALPTDAGAVEVVIRIVDEAESRMLNARYRGKDAPTNVLSFPFEAPAGVETRHLGDLVICAQVVEREAAQQGKNPLHHWAHMVVHGMLHLGGLDHQTDVDAGYMESQEKQILARFGIDDPYRVN
jgi:probable rRNA maturation factor